jgi:hypothetical protein
LGLSVYLISIGIKLNTSPSFIDKLHKNEQVMDMKIKIFGGYNANKIKENLFIAARGPKNYQQQNMILTQ